MKPKADQDPSKAIAETVSLLAQTGSRIEHLAEARQRALLLTDGLAEVRRLDDQIADAEASITAMTERVKLLELEVSKIEAVQHERRRLAAVAEVKTRLAERVSAAQRLDEVLAQLLPAFADLERIDDALFADWAVELPKAETLRFLRLMNLESLSTHRRQRMVVGVIRDAVGRGPYNFAAEAEKRNSELAAAIEASPFGETVKAVAS
jgi:hypothetical protein